MENLIKTIEKNINKSIETYIEKISEEWKIDEEELKTLWENLENTRITSRRNSISKKQYMSTYYDKRG